MRQRSQSRFELPGIARFYLARLRECLWLKPLVSCLLSIAAVFIAGLAESYLASHHWPDISPKSLETLLSIMSASMLVIAMFAVGAMLSAYGSASNSATPRSFPLVVGDDVSQNALSTFIGAFIFSIVGLVALLNGYYASSGRFVLFLITLFVFAVVVLAFVRWVDRIARLGRLGHTIDKVEAAADAALQLRARLPTMGARRVESSASGIEICTEDVGYVQNIDLSKLQRSAEQWDCFISVCAVPGAFVTPTSPLARVAVNNGSTECRCTEEIIAAFVIGGERTFESDPRFGLVVISEIASRALSSAVNDPGTAIDTIGSLVRLLVRWSSAKEGHESADLKFDQVAMPELEIGDLFDDAFNAIARDGAASIEVAIRLQKAYLALSRLGNAKMQSAAEEYSKLAVRYAEKSLILEEEIEAVRMIAAQIIPEAVDDAPQGAEADA